MTSFCKPQITISLVEIQWAQMLETSGIQSALVVAPHGDDETLGAGGLIAKLTRSGARVRVLFAAVDASSHYGLEKPTVLAERLRELEVAADILQFRYRVLYSGAGMLERLDTLPQRELVDVIESELDSFRPDLLLLPEGRDYDQDHRACFQAGLAATRPIPKNTGKHFVRKVLTYEMPKLIWHSAFKPRVYWDISDSMELKMQAVRAYHTQLRESPHIRSLNNLRALAHLRGSEIGVDYAEGFDTLRWLP
jgi:N-acetylglucosamine malate deacetylase 1